MQLNFFEIVDSFLKRIVDRMIQSSARYLVGYIERINTTS